MPLNYSLQIPSTYLNFVSEDWNQSFQNTLKAKWKELETGRLRFSIQHQTYVGREKCWQLLKNEYMRRKRKRQVDERPKFKQGSKRLRWLQKIYWQKLDGLEVNNRDALSYGAFLKAKTQRKLLKLFFSVLFFERLHQIIALLNTNSIWPIKCDPPSFTVRARTAPHFIMSSTRLPKLVLALGETRSELHLNRTASRS